MRRSEGLPAKLSGGESDIEAHTSRSDNRIQIVVTCLILVYTADVV